MQVLSRIPEKQFSGLVFIVTLHQEKATTCCYPTPFEVNHKNPRQLDMQKIIRKAALAASLHVAFEATRGYLCLFLGTG